MPDITPMDQRDESELLRLVRHDRPEVAKESLASLVRRHSERAPEVAADLVSSHADPQVRAMAAVTLGRRPVAEASAILTRALRDPDPHVVRRAAQSLVRVGDESALAALAQVRLPEDRPAARAVTAARMFLGHRLGYAAVLAEPGPVTEFGRRRGTEITFGGKAKLPKDDLTAAIAEEVPMLTFSSAGVRAFTCSGQAGALAVAAEAGEFDLTRPQMLGALVRERPCPGGYSLDCYLLSDDRDGTGGRQPRLWLVRPSGRVVYSGVVEVGDKDASFAITGAVAPYARPVKVVGTRTASGAVSIETALVGKPATDAATATVLMPQEPVMR